MTAVKIGRSWRAALLLAGQRLPERWPFRARGGNDVVDLEAAERFRMASPPSALFFTCVVPLVEIPARGT